MKVCSVCRESKPLECFYKDKSKRDGLYPQCKECKYILGKATAKRYREENKEAIAARNKQWNLDNPEKLAQRQKRYRLNNKDRLTANRIKRRYNITIEQYNQMLEDQDYACAICKRPNPSGHQLCIDHNHNCCPGEESCGKCVRDLLCKKCNFGIGNFSDSEELLKAAISYLKRHKENGD